MIEFGVAGGNGLVELERVVASRRKRRVCASRCTDSTAAPDFPDPIDHRDVPYAWRGGFFEMDVARLQSRLNGPRLVLGDLADTIPGFFDTNPAPVGFVGDRPRLLLVDC